MSSASARARRSASTSIDEESPQVQASTRRAGRFLNLSAIITVLLAAVAVAMAARRYTRRHLDNVALMKCMGASQRLVLQMTVIELGLVALVAALAGSLLGWLAQELLTRLVGDLVHRRAAAADARAGADGRGDRARHPGRFRAAAAAAAQARAARARAAQEPGAAAASLLRLLRARGRGAARRPVLAGARPAPGRLPGRGNRRHARGAVRRGLPAGRARRAAARRGRRRLALWRCEPCAPRARERRAGRRLRPRADGAAAARGGAQRPPEGLAREPAGRHAELLHDQHPGHGDRRSSRSSWRHAACRRRSSSR